MSTLAPPGTDVLAHFRRQQRRLRRQQQQQQQQQQQHQFYHNNSSGSQSAVSNSSASNESPPAPPLPQRPLSHHHQMLVQQYHPQRDSYCRWSDGSGSTRLPTFPEEEIDSFQSESEQMGRIKVNRSGGNSRYSRQQQQGARVSYQVRHLGATAVVYPSAALVSSTSPSTPGGGHATRGCGGRCETCENVCYYLLQVAFAMGVVIGTSLCIAGAALRRSPGRQLQVLLYIGALVALVSGLLLVVQCRARRQANRRHSPPLPPAATQLIPQADAAAAVQLYKFGHLQRVDIPTMQHGGQSRLQAAPSVGVDRTHVPSGGSDAVWWR